MNPARTLGPAIASANYKGIWVYAVGPISSTLLGTWSYNLILVIEKPVQAISSHSFSLKLCRMRSNAREISSKDPLNHL